MERGRAPRKRKKDRKPRVAQKGFIICDSLIPFLFLLLPLPFALEKDSEAVEEGNETSLRLKGNQT